METLPFFVGVDFGSSFSAVSVIRPDAEGLSPQSCDFLDEVDGTEAATALVLAGDGTAILQSDHFHPASLNWFKMALLHQNEQPRGELFRDASRAWAHMAAKDMACIFLRALLRHPLEELQSSRPWADRPRMHFSVVFTFPASWGHDDRKRMKEAVQAIDIQALVPGSQFSTSYVSEQEAAFLSLLARPAVADLEGKELVVVCDAGGWTLDTASYVMCPSVDSAKRLPSVRECGKARSVARGAITLHDGFDRLLRDGIEAITGDRNWLDNAPERLRVALRLQAIVEDYKSGVKHHQRIRIKFGSGGRYIVINRDRLDELFKMSAEHIIASINAALQNAVTAYRHQYGVVKEPVHIALTGGLSHNPYIREAVVAGMKQQYGGSVNVILPEDKQGRFAVAHGAAIHAAIDRLRHDNTANVLAARTSPARFFVKYPSGSEANLVMQGQPISTDHTIWAVPEVVLAVEGISGRRSLVVYYAVDSMARKYVTFTLDPVLQHRGLSLKFCSDREFGYLTIELLVDGVARPGPVWTENHFES